MTALTQHGRKAKGGHSGKVVAPVSGDQVPVRVHKESLPGIDEECSADCHAVCFVQPADGAPGLDGSADMSAFKMGQEGLKGEGQDHKTQQNVVQMISAGVSN